MACSLGHEFMVRKLIKLGADLNLNDDVGFEVHELV
jgi:hypothetical protein